jgi:hypothetical protein
MSAKKKGIVSLIFDPFQVIAGSHALIIGIAVIVLSSLIASRTHCFFEGVIDALILPKVTEPWWIYTAQGLINWLVLASLIAISGRLVAKSKYRLIDVFGTQALARLPYLFIAALSFTPSLTRYPQHTQAIYLKTSPVIAIQPYDIYLFLVGMILIVVAMIWAAILMYRAFSVSCNAKGPKAIGYFIVIMIIAEIITKTVYTIYDLNLHKS